jgi:hypothetical protein
VKPSPQPQHLAATAAATDEPTVFPPFAYHHRRDREAGRDRPWSEDTGPLSDREGGSLSDGGRRPATLVTRGHRGAIVAAGPQG